MNERLGGDGMTALWQSDAAQYNMLKPRFNANIDWAGEKCIAKPSAPETPKPKPGIFDQINPF